jgi:phosphoribosylanthranilate isomerase
MTWVKICGMTNLEDALVAVDAGADAVGFVFYEKSPRSVTVETAREIVAKLPEKVEKIGVFAGESVARAAEIGSHLNLDGLQIYPLSYERDGSDGKSEGQSIEPKKVYLAFPIKKFVSEEHGITVDINDPERTLSSIVLDSGSGQQPGGTGIAFDWNNAAPVVSALSRTRQVVIAGGLTPQNVSEAIGILQPWGVDVASGVEASPGKKDPEKVRAFVRAVREMDCGAS